VAPLNKSRRDYHDLRRQYLPEDIKLAVIAESPPVSGLYFYDPTGKSTEPLFAALMRQLHVYPCTKQEGLRKFQQSGWVLVEATYKPVNIRGVSNRKRDAAILADYSVLKADLENLLSNRSTPLILIKANVCRVIGPKLLEDGFNVLNRAITVYFPSSGRQQQFHKQLDAVRKATGI
jgi:hypothetical protein